MKLFTYKDFTLENGHLSFNDCQLIHNEMLNSFDKFNLEFQEYWSDFLTSCVSYAEARSKWFLLTKEEQMNFDNHRTNRHNEVIQNLNILERLAKRNQKATSWFDKFQDDRKRIGDFACYISYIHAINAR